MPLKKSSLHFMGERRNIGAYEQPFSGVGMEFEPLGGANAETGFVLHEAGYLDENPNWNFPNVYSPFWRIYYDFESLHSVRFGKRVTRLRADRVYVIPNHQRFDCIGDPPVAKLWMSLSCTRSADPSSPMPIAIHTNEIILSLVKEISLLFKTGEEQNRERIYQLSVSFTLYVLSRPEIKWQAPMPEKVVSVVEGINSDPAFPWNKDAFSRAAKMSADGFARLFKKWMNVTPSRYVQQVRIREACHMLVDTDIAIDRIAQQLGFADRFHFSRIFKKHTDTSPASYRKQHRV